MTVLWKAGQLLTLLGTLAQVAGFIHRARRRTQALLPPQPEPYRARRIPSLTMRWILVDERQRHRLLAAWTWTPPARHASGPRRHSLFIISQE